MHKPPLHNYNYRGLYPPLSPVAAVEVTVANGFGDVHGLHFLRAGEVGDSAGQILFAATLTYCNNTFLQILQHL